METTAESLEKALRGLPINALIVIAGELDASSRAAEEAETKKAIDTLLSDIVHISAVRFSGFHHLREALFKWEKEHNSQEWFQRFLASGGTEPPK